MKNQKLKEMIFITMFIVIEIVLTMTPLGFIQLGVIKATTLHIPVILAGLLLGYKGGFYVGLSFGVLSVLINTFNPSITSFVFTPFYSIGDISGNMFSLIIAIIPRILLGVLPALLFKILKKVEGINFKIILISVISTLTHTIMVLSLIYLFFKDSYVQAIGINTNQLFGFLLGIISTNGLAEMIVGTIIVLAMYKALRIVIKENI